MRLEALVKPANATDQEVSWTSFSATIVSIGRQSGEIRALRKGQSIIEVITNEGGFTGLCAISVIDPNEVPIVAEIESHFVEEEVVLYPNPLKTRYQEGIRINISGSAEVAVFSIEGKHIGTFQFTSSEDKLIRKEAFPAKGDYILRIKNASNEMIEKVNVQ